MTRTPCVTLSFDDGHPKDIKLAGILSKYGLRATFYVPINNAEQDVLDANGIQQLVSLGFEIGGHGVSHRRFTKLSDDEAKEEISQGKKSLEQLSGQTIFGLAFPGGKFGRKHVHMAMESGYKYCRTISMFRQKALLSDPLLHTSLQFLNRPWNRYGRHLLKRPNLASWVLAMSVFRSCGNHPIEMGKELFERALSHGEVFHLWGHSWELDHNDGWKQLEELFEYISRRPKVKYMTNEEAYEALVQS